MTISINPDDATKKRRTNLYLDPDLVRKCRAKAILEKSNLSAVVSRLLRQYLES